LGEGLTTLNRKKEKNFLRNVTNGLGIGWIISNGPRQQKTDMRFGAQNVMCVYIAGPLMTVARGQDEFRVAVSQWTILNFSVEMEVLIFT
jgi:hypothetical protein